MPSLKQASESWKPYDIMVTDASGGITLIEVKSSRVFNRDIFPMSREELSCAAQAGNAYVIVRLLGAGARRDLKGKKTKK